MLYVTNISLDNVRCYRSAKIDLGKPGTSILICGNNGSGKSALLRSIAMGLCDQASAGALLRDLSGDFIRKTAGKQKVRKAAIRVDLVGRGRSHYGIRTELATSSDAIFETVKTVTDDSTGRTSSRFPWNQIFVAAYGAGLRTHGSEDYVQYFAPDAVYSLFEYSYPLQSPELAWRRLLDAGKDSRAKAAINKSVEKILRELLALDAHDMPSIEHNGLFIRSSWGKHELNALGDGYQALVTIALDILSWKFLSENHKAILEAYESNQEPKWAPIVDFEALDGIVIIDEIEKHLHPKLQHYIISYLKIAFPKMQFIISTHSPLCVSGTADVKEGSFKIFKTQRIDDGSITLVEMEVPVGLSADEIFEKYFEIGDTRNLSLQNDLAEFRQLYLKKRRTMSDKRRLKSLRQNLAQARGAADQDKSDITRERLEKRLNELISSLEEE